MGLHSEPDSYDEVANRYVSAGYGFGSCPSFTKMSSLDISKYKGQWYEVQRDWTIWFELFGSCITATYNELPNGNIQVLNRVAYWPFNFLPYTADLTADCTASDAACAVGLKE